MWALHVAAMTGGLVVGKVTHFLAAAKGAEMYARRQEEKHPDGEPKHPPSSVRGRLARWSKAMIDVLDRPRLGPLVMLASSGVGFPPLAVVTVAAGLRRINLGVFVLITTLGCLARFLVTSWLVVQGISIGH